MSEWISVKDRLPKVGERVIIARPYDVGEIRVEQGMLMPGGGWKVYGTNAKKVTHWMPMPEAPEEVR